MANGRDAVSHRRDEGTPPLVSVVVPTRNRAGLLPHLLEALERQEYAPYEVIVVDDASHDDTARILASWEGEGRRSVRLPLPSGSYAARNRGIAEARGSLIAFTDDDCLPAPGWLSALANAVAEPEVVAAQGVTVSGPGTITPFTHQIEARRPGPPYRTCNMLYRRSLLGQIGGFDASLRWYADNLLGLRARAVGKIAFAPDAVVCHPPRPREWRDRAAWLARFDADRRHREALRALGAERIQPPGKLLPVVLWIVRPLLKQSLAHTRYLIRHPIRYLRGMRPMLREKRALLRAIADLFTGQDRAARGRPAPLPLLPDEPLVSVVVVTRDRPALLEGTLRALAAQRWQRYELIIVDHGSESRTALLARREGARYLPAPNSTLAWARQAGVSAAGGDIVAFTDDDCLPAPGWLAEIVAAFRSDGRLAGVQGRTVGERGPVGSHAVEVSGPDPLYQTCNIAYRRVALQRSGGFDLRFVGHFEDTALGARVLEQGPIGFAPDALVVHRAMPRRPLDRARWRSLLDDEYRLARDYRAFYRRTRGPGFLLTVIGRWLLGSPVKTLVRELPRAGRDPGGYIRLWWDLLRERKELLAALREM